MRRSIVVLLLGALLQPAAAFGVPSITYVRNVQNLPIAGNNGAVTAGGDVGWSARFGTTTSYFFFGDTDRTGGTTDFVGTFGAKSSDTNIADGFAVT